MSKLEISSVKYPGLEKLKTLANKSEGVEPLLNILPTYEALVNAKVEELEMSTEEIEEVVENDKRNVSMSSNKSNRPFFTDENGKAMKAVKNMQKQNKTVSNEELVR